MKGNRKVGGAWNMLYNMCRKCKTPVKYPATYCSQCVQVHESEQEHNKRLSGRRYDKTRDKKYTRFYASADWKRLSSAYIQDKAYRCEGKDCTRVATEVHHIKPIQTEQGWLLRLEWTNLMAVCIRCHNKEHNRFR